VSSTALDPYRDRYAARTLGMTASEIRALFAVASRPEIVSLAGGMPNLAALPLDAVGEVLGELVVRRGTTALQYGSSQGDPVLREHICEIMALEGIRAAADDVVVTVGSQQALDLVARIFLDPGDVVLAESPSYVGALGTFSSAEANVRHVAMDDDGLIPEALREALEMLAREGRSAKFLYTVPNYHNPAGVSMTLERRRAIVALAAEYDLLILEDNPYGLLGFDREPLPALRAMDADRVLYLGSFSKTFAPGLRVGWVLAPHAVREKLVLASEAQILCPSNFSQMAVSAYLETQPWRDQIKIYREVYRERRDAMLDALAQLMPPGTTWTRPDGGFYTWLTLPGDLDAKAMLPRAVKARVAYVSGTAFFADGGGARHMRLSYCFPTPDRIREGVRRLAGVIEEETEVRAMFRGRTKGQVRRVPHPDAGEATPDPGVVPRGRVAQAPPPNLA
jgi:DNA-binding transcriptional MocR family regulator